MKKWWRFSVTHATPEEFIGAISIPLSGCEITGLDSALLYIEGDESERLQLEEELKKLNFTITACEEVPLQNWVLQARTPQPPISGRGWQINFITEEQEAPATRNKGALTILPGFGFGTGEHATTSLLLDFIGELNLEKIKKSADLGCGSAILALLLAERGVPTIDAIDIDALALENAALNCSINQLTAPIKLIQGGAEKLQGQYDLIVSNIYAEVLASFEESFYNHLPKGGILLLSGVMLEKDGIIRNAFLEERWDYQIVRTIKGWVGYYLEKI